MKQLFISILGILLLILLSCDRQDESKSFFYVSSVRQLGTQEPFHEILIQKKDTLLKYDFWDKSRSYAKVNFDKLKPKDKIEYNDGKVFDKRSNITSFENLYLYVDSTNYYTYLKTEQGKQINKDKFLEQVQDRIFQTNISSNKTPNSTLDIKETLKFSKDSLTYFWDYYYDESLLHSETETVKINFFEVENQLFLVPSTAENPYPILQVYKLSDDKIELRNFIDFETKSKLYSSVDSFNTSPYQSYSLCKDDFQKIYYVGEDVKYNKGLEHLLNHLQDDAPRAANNGFINIHFTINCKGEVGRLGLELLDRNYKPATFEPEIVKHITDKVLKIKTWDNLNLDPYYSSKDVKAFFFIKINDHKIADVCP